MSPVVFPAFRYGGLDLLQRRNSIATAEFFMIGYVVYQGSDLAFCESRRTPSLTEPQFHTTMMLVPPTKYFMNEKIVALKFHALNIIFPYMKMKVLQSR